MAFAVEKALQRINQINKKCEPPLFGIPVCEIVTINFDHLYFFGLITILNHLSQIEDMLQLLKYCVPLI